MSMETTQKKPGNSSSVSFKDSFKTKLITIMILVAAIPLLVAVIVSYVTSTNKARTDSQDIQEWQAWYIQAEFSKILDTNMVAMESLASAPSTIMYMRDPTAGYVPDSEMLTQLNFIDNWLGDGNITVLTGKDGMQVLRASGKLVDVHEREYFQKAMAGTPFVSDVITSASTGARQITIAVPVTDSETGEALGIVQRNYNLTDLHEFLAEESEDAFIADRTGLIAAHSQYDYQGENAHEEESRSQSVFMTSGLDEGYYYADTGKGYKAFMSYVKEPKSSYTIVVAASEKEILGSARKSAMIVIIVGIAMLIAAIVISFTMAKSFTDPLAGVGASLKALADGRFVKVDKFDKRKDEFGEISRDTNSVIKTLDEIVSDIKASASTVGTSSEELSDMADQISQTAGDVANAVQEIASGATQQADEIQTATENVGHIGEAVAGVQNSSGSLTDLAGKMKDASEISSRSLQDLQNSSAEMTSKIDDIASTIQATQSAVDHISEKVEGITSIATQTNLLSLNASIEAARAGEAGKGFAVVAEEIGKLAEDSKAMADEIRKEMDTLLEQSKAAVVAAEDVKQGNNEQQIAIGETLDAVNGMLQDISSTVGGVQQISQGAERCDSSKNAVVDVMSALSAISEENAASSEETGASMQELSATVTTLAESASSLKEIAEKLNEEMEFFK